jgi:hypothetical protein
MVSAWPHSPCSMAYDGSKLPDELSWDGLRLASGVVVSPLSSIDVLRLEPSNRREHTETIEVARDVSARSVDKMGELQAVVAGEYSRDPPIRMEESDPPLLQSVITVSASSRGVARGSSSYARSKVHISSKSEGLERMSCGRARRPRERGDELAGALLCR